jgi:hypothetical protein
MMILIASAPSWAFGGTCRRYAVHSVVLVQDIRDALTVFEASVGPPTHVGANTRLNTAGDRESRS